MILLSSGNSMRRVFHLTPVETTPVVPTADWYRFWRVDVRTIQGLGEVMLFTNHETLYTLVADSSDFRQASDFVGWFMLRYGELFNGHFGYHGRIKEEILLHRGVDRRVAAVMTYYFSVIADCPTIHSHAEFGPLLNRIPILSRNLVPAEEFARRMPKGV